jgi:alkylation response protein AidB-like acyl-CoA dehydrogenase
MHFDDSPEEADFRAKARSWLEAHAPRKGELGDFTSDTEHDAAFAAACKGWQAVLHEGGWAGLTWSTDHGGQGLAPAFEHIFQQEQAAFGVSTATLAVGIGMVGPTIIAHGTDAQKARYLPPMLRGEEGWCQFFSEPGAGSDLAGLATAATRNAADDGWVVNGQKVWTSYARHSDHGILLARTDPSRPKHHGISCILLDLASPGIDIRPIRQINGAAEFNEVFFTDVPVPDACVLGPVNEGWRVAMTTLANERGLVGTDWPGFDHMVTVARERGLAADPGVRQRLVDVFIGEQLLRFFGYRMQTALSRGEPFGPLASSVNLFFAGHLKRGADVALSLLGAGALAAGDDAPYEGLWQHHFLTAPSVRIASGTDEIQRNSLGERALGLPREPRPDKDQPFRR